MSEELKPCPFCGEQVKQPVSRPASTDKLEGFVAFLACYCGGYSATAHRMGSGDTERAAVLDVISKWNRRHSPDQAVKLPAVDGDMLPGVGSPVLIHLASSDTWMPHNVVGYYAWGDLGGNDTLHRIFVRVRDADGHLNARLLKDVRKLNAPQ